MQKIGIIRRIDDLGRVIIPKEIRRTFGIREGDPLELMVDKENKIIGFTPYSMLSETEIVTTIFNSLWYQLELDLETEGLAIISNVNVLSSNGVCAKTINDKLRRSLWDVAVDCRNEWSVYDADSDNETSCFVFPVCVKGDACGAFVYQGSANQETKYHSVLLMAAKIAADLLAD